MSTILRGLTFCPMCGISGGAMAHGRTICRKCAEFFDPTPLQQWCRITGTPLKDVPELAGVPRRTVMRAARGTPVGTAPATALSKITGIPAEKFSKAG